MTNKKTPAKIVLWCVLCVILLAILVPLISLLVQKYIKKSSVPMFMGYAYMVVLTPSMTGSINQGDMVIIKKTNDYKVNDVITYVEAEGATPVTHRIVYYDQDTGAYITKGDANYTSDPYPVTQEQIAGKVVSIIPKFGWVARWFINGGGLLYLVAMIAVVIGGAYFWNLTKSASNTTSEDSNKQSRN